jgi:hypothetical protein
VHVTDINSERTSDNEIRAVVEVRREGKQPTSAMNHASNPRLALVGAAAEKAKSQLDNEFGKERATIRR